MAADPNRIAALFAAALALSSSQERAAYLDEACGGDAELRRRVEALLQAHADAGSFLEKPAVAEPVTTDEPALSEGPGTRIGPYKLLQQIGTGGMGVVYMAEQQEPIRRMVALKIIKPGMDSAAVVARFEAERQALALMDHHNIARIFDGGVTDSGRPFFVMELVKGIPITRFCDENRLTPRERLELFVPVCQAVQHAHQKGVIHRDLKPSNVLVTLYDGQPVPKVIDFGVAKALHQKLTERTMFTAFGTVIGTLEYMSPEQAEMNTLDVDTRGDVYSLGVLLYELLTGTTPLQRERLKQAAYDEILRLIREEEPPRPSNRLSGSGAALARISSQRKMEPAQLARLLRGELDWIVMKALEKERGRRYETALGLARDVEHYLHDESVEACPPSLGYRLGKFARKYRVVLSTAAAFAALLFVVFGLIVYGAWRIDRQSAERRHEQALIVARNNDAFKATLDQVETALKSGRIAEVGALLGQAARQIDDRTIPDLRERHAQLEKDARAVRELNDIFEERWMISRSDTRLDNTRAKRRYPALFQQYGLAVGGEPAAQSAEKIHRSLIADALSSGLVEWFFVDPKYPGLLSVLDLLDPEPERATLRAAIANGDAARVQEIVKRIDGSRLAPAYAIGLADMDSHILKEAWATHPDSFPLVLALNRNWYCKSRVEAVSWSRTAVALRPNNALSHYYLALALNPNIGRGVTRGDRDNAVKELRRAIQLAPRFAKAYGQLAMNLRQEKTPEALATARKAIELDDKNLYGLIVILWDQMAKKDFVEAAKAYRRIAGMNQEESLRAAEDQSAFMQGYTAGVMAGARSRIEDGLIGSGRPFEAYRLQIDNGRPNVIVYNPACAAVLAGTGQGLDAPPPAERPAILKHALKWLNADLDASKKDAAVLPALGASSVGLLGSPSGNGPLLLTISALAAGGPNAASKKRIIIHETMSHWLSDLDLARVRDDQWFAKLSADEREQWRKLWSEVRFLRDRTAPRKTTPLPRD